MKLNVYVNGETILENSNVKNLYQKEKCKGTVDGYVSIDGKVYAIVFFGELHKIIKIPIEEIITNGYE